MNELGKLLFRRMTGQDWEQAHRIPKPADIKTLVLNQIASRFPLREIGWSQEGPVYLSEEERESHIHILGAPGEGKSKFLELLIRQDIQRGYPCCLLDPSENGDTANKILKYCASIGFEKVCYINPVDFFEFKRIPIINPIKHDAPPNISVGNLMDSLKILWASGDFAETPRLQKYIPAVLQALHSSRSTLPDTKYFLSRYAFTRQREHILDALPPDDLNRQHLQHVFVGNPQIFEQFQSTVNRLNVFSDSVIRLMLGSKREPLSFNRFITEGWCILVNLDPQQVWGTEQIQQRLIGTLIISEIVHAISRLLQHGWKGIYYLYIDEVGDYATPKLAYILDKKRKTGLRLTLAHQRFDQITDRNVLSAVENSAKSKVLFYTPGKKDREQMMRDMGYGGDLPDRQVSYILGQVRKQHAAMRFGKQSPRIVRINDIPDVRISKDVLDAYKRKIYAYTGFYSPDEINHEINDRFTQTGQPPQALRRSPPKQAPPRKAKPSAGRKREEAVGATSGEPDPIQDTRSSETRAVPDDSAGGVSVLRRKTGRSTRKVNPIPPKTNG